MLLVSLASFWFVCYLVSTVVWMAHNVESEVSY